MSEETNSTTAPGTPAAGAQTPVPVPQNLNTHLKYVNFDPLSVNLEETVNVTLLVDISYSMQDHKDELNEQLKSICEWMQKFHQAHKIFVSIGTFDSKMDVLTGFQNVANVKTPQFNPTGDSTLLYASCLDFVKNVINQQQRAMDAGILSKSIFFVITDGADNASKQSDAKAVKDLISGLTQNEATAGTFMSALVGIGAAPVFERAQKEMGIQKLFVIDPSKGDKENKKAFKEVFGWLSASISSASTQPGALVVF